jgi:hypothetical protein
MQLQTGGAALSVLRSYSDRKPGTRRIFLAACSIAHDKQEIPVHVRSHYLVFSPGTWNVGSNTGVRGMVPDLFSIIIFFPFLVTCAHPGLLHATCLNLPP